MEYNFASEGTSNSYFDRIIQTAVDVELREMVFCLKSCKIAYRANSNPDLTLNQKLCLGIKQSI